MAKSVGVVGAGALGRAAATVLARSGTEVLIANRGDTAALAKATKSMGEHVQAATMDRVLAADIVVLAVPFGSVAEAVRGAPSWKGRIVVDATNALNMTDFSALDLGGRLSSHMVAESVAGARVVKAFNHLAAPLLASDPAVTGRKRVLFVSGDDDGANREVAALIDRTGFAAVVLGKLAEGGVPQQWGGAFTMLDLALQPTK